MKGFKDNKICYIIVNFRSSEVIHKIISKFNDISSSIYVVDCSGDYLKISEEILITPNNKQNIGFGNAVNLAVSKIEEKPDFIFLINPDVIFEINDIDKMLLCLSNSENGAVVPISLGSKNSVKTSVFRKKIGIFEEIKMGFKSYRKSLVIEKLINTRNKCLKIEFIDASFCLMKYECFINSGGFPKSIFMYGEDLVISHRIKKNGYSIVLNTEVFIHHPGGATFGSLKLMRLKRLFYSSFGAGKAISIIRNDKLSFFYIFSFIVILVIRKLLNNKNEIQVPDFMSIRKK
jgi:GT2 family glycosyltransferase